MERSVTQLVGFHLYYNFFFFGFQDSGVCVCGESLNNNHNIYTSAFPLDRGIEGNKKLHNDTQEIL